MRIKKKRGYSCGLNILCVTAVMMIGMSLHTIERFPPQEASTTKQTIFRDGGSSSSSSSSSSSISSTTVTEAEKDVHRVVPTTTTTTIAQQDASQQPPNNTSPSSPQINMTKHQQQQEQQQQQQTHEGGETNHAYNTTTAAAPNATTTTTTTVPSWSDHVNDRPFEPPPWIRNYLAFHRSQIGNATKGNALPNTARWLQWYCPHRDGKRHCGGLADRLKGMMEALILSIVDRRVLLLEEWEGTPATGRHPLTACLEPNLIDWSTLPSNDTSAVTEFLTFKDAFGGHKSDSQRLIKDEPCAFCKDGYDGVRFTGNLLGEPERLYDSTCRGIFGNEGDKYRVFSDLFWTMFRFSARVHAEADRLRGPIVPANRNYYVAAHIRTGNFSGGEADLLRQNTAEDWDRFVHCVRVVTGALQRRCGGDAPPAYLASDNNDAKRYVKDRVNGTYVHAPGVEQFHVDLHPSTRGDDASTGDGDATAGYRAVMGEFKILIDASCIIMSDSGFSKMGRILSRAVPRCAVSYSRCTDPSKVEKMTSKVTCPT